MDTERYKALTREREMDKLLEARDVALERVHKIVTSGDKKLKGLLSFNTIYERMCLNIENLKQRSNNTDTHVKGTIILEFKQPDENGGNDVDTD